MKIILDDNVLNKQQEWGSLLQLDELIIPELPSCPLTLNERLFLATLWLHDGTKGGNIDFPQTSFQLLCYEITRSHNSLLLFSFIFFMHLSFPFFEQPYCAWSSHGSNYDYNNPKNSNYLSPRIASVLELLCLFYYYIEIYLRLAINSGERSRRGLDFYTKLRLFIVIILTWDCLVSIIYTHPERMIRALLPFVYITRRKSLRQMSWGLMLVAYKCIPVFLLLLTIVLAWSYLGRMIFGNLELEGGDQFGSLISAFLTTLESYSCRGYVIFALDPLFQINASSSLFFVSLTIFADIFCQALIVATGTRQYQLYSVTVFRKELLNRKRAMLAVFGVLQQYSQELALASLNQSPNDDQSVETTSSRPPSYRGLLPTPRLWNDRESVTSSNSETQPTASTNIESLYDPTLDASEQRVSKKAWLAFCSYLTGKKKISPELAELLFDKEMEIEETGQLDSIRNSWNRDSLNKKKKSKASCEGLSVVGFFRVAALLDGEINIEGDIDSDDESEGLDETPTVTIKRPMTKRSSSESFRMPNKESLDPSLGIMLAENGTNKKSTEEPSETLLLSKSSSVFVRSAKWIYKRSRMFARYVAETEIILDFMIPLTHERSLTRHCIFDMIVSSTRILLAVQLLYITIPSSPSYWYDIGWGLQGFFWFEMYIRIASLYTKRRRRNLRLFLLNVITTILYSTISRSQSHSEEISGRMIAYICFQWFRLVQVVLPFRISAVIRGLLSLVIRVVFIVFTVMYFFSTIGYYRFCNAFDGEEAESVDDFAVKWAPYDKQLNFNSLLQTLYTLFEVAVLGSWSYVMRAAMLSGFLSALLYFYAYRLVMTLVVMPILTSFIIQAYNARSIKLMNDEKTLLEKRVKERQEITINQPHEMNAILEGDESLDDAPAAVEEKERSTEYSRASRLTDSSAAVNRRSDRKLIVTRVSNNDQSMISFWSSTGTEHATPINKTPSPIPSPRPSSTIGLNRTSLNSLQETIKVSNETDRIQQLSEMIKELNLSLTAKNTAYDTLKLQVETINEENRMLKMHIEEFTKSVDGSADIDLIGI